MCSERESKGSAEILFRMQENRFIQAAFVLLVLVGIIVFAQDNDMETQKSSILKCRIKDEDNCRFEMSQRCDHGYVVEIDYIQNENNSKEEILVFYCQPRKRPSERPRRTPNNPRGLE